MVILSALKSCPNSKPKGKAQTDQSFTHYFSFPSNVNLCTKWKQFCGLGENVNCSWKTLCSRHFDSGDIIHSTKKVTVKATAEPINEQIQPVNGILELEKKMDALRQKVHLLETNLANCKSKLQLKSNALRQQQQQHKKRLQKAICWRKQAQMRKNKAEQKLEEANKILKKVFTPKQIKKAKTGKGVKWDEEDITRGISFRAKSTRAYNHVIKRLKWPFPSVSTLQRWTKDIKFEPGIQENVLKMMSGELKDKHRMERGCIISCDEMSVSSNACYDFVQDQVLGWKSNLQVVFVRGLFSKWKQPIFYDFDCPITKDLLIEVGTLNNCNRKIIRKFLMRLLTGRRGLEV